MFYYTQIYHQVLEFDTHESHTHIPIEQVRIRHHDK